MQYTYNIHIFFHFNLWNNNIICGKLPHNTNITHVNNVRIILLFIYYSSYFIIYCSYSFSYFCSSILLCTCCRNNANFPIFVGLIKEYLIFVPYITSHDLVQYYFVQYATLWSTLKHFLWFCVVVYVLFFCAYDVLLYMGLGLLAHDKFPLG